MNGEFKSISQYMAHEDETERLYKIDEHEYRSMFQRDRDRILYSKEFRRLSGKTQIFLTGTDDNVRTRLTHTLEVAQIAETIAERLKLNTMLTRAIALGHDIGHTPFGHIGERTLNYFMNGCFPYYGYTDNLIEEDKGFKHNLQSIRVARDLEKNLDNITDEQIGLNLTKYTLWGIKNHSSVTYKSCEYCENNKVCRYKNKGKNCNGNLSLNYYRRYEKFLSNEKDWTLEGVIVAYADEIAQRHHDIEDGIYAGIIDVEDLCAFMRNSFSFNDVLCNKLDRIREIAHERKYGYEKTTIQELSRLIVDSYVTDYTECMSSKVLELSERIGINAENKKYWRERAYTNIVNSSASINEYFNFSIDFSRADKEISKYLSNHILYSNVAQCMDGKASYIIRQLIKAYLTNPQQLPDGTIITIISDWNKVNSVNDNDTKSYKTEASRARDRLKECIRKDDHDITRILLRRICDHIAGMTDQYAMLSFERLYGSKDYEY